MLILKEHLAQMWYESEDGTKISIIDGGEAAPSDKIPYVYVSRFPTEVITSYSLITHQEDVDKCKHPRKAIRRTGGWIDGVVGRECTECHGTQTKCKGFLHKWPKKWTGGSTVKLFSGAVSMGETGEKCVVAMVNSGEYTLREAMIVYTTACERCMNVLLNKYLGEAEGYLEYSEDWYKANTSCVFCLSTQQLPPESDE